MDRCQTCETLLTPEAEDCFCSFDCENAWWNRTRTELRRQAEFELYGEPEAESDLEDPGFEDAYERSL